MSTQINPKLPRFVKSLFDFLYGLLIFTCTILVLIMVLSPLITKGSGIALTASVPVGLGSGEDHRINIQVTGVDSKGIRAASVSEVQGILRLETDNWVYIFFGYFRQLLIALGLVYIFHLLRAVLQDILQGDPFSMENSVRIRRLGYTVLLLAFLLPIIEYIAASQVLRELRIEPALSLPSLFDAGYILISLLVLVLAQVWSYGLELKRDQALTI